MKKITAPLQKADIRDLKAGQQVLLSGFIYTARDQAHKRFIEAVKRGVRLPFELKGEVIYYCGPTNTPKGKTIGSCGPTTSSRMDKFTPALLKKGLTAMIGKGSRSKEIVKAVKKYGAVYFLAPAGCGALLAEKVRSAKIIAYKDLGPEAVRKLEVKDFPLIVAIDCKGRSVYGAK